MKAVIYTSTIPLSYIFFFKQLRCGAGRRGEMEEKKKMSEGEKKKVIDHFNIKVNAFKCSCSRTGWGDWDPRGDPKTHLRDPEMI